MTARDEAADRLDCAVEEAVASAPPLTDDQRDAVMRLLSGVSR